ncbi:hypothetical protein HF521_011792 [Silurus meridionalis]|uniref:Uncharacterized protein n=1 Tax=Silurus meridionalis TaxID=175797 RepID=A0A8T0AFA6_SILME|nr:hypothetical protein HF521_011792 [Silurus meridionalis]
MKRLEILFSLVLLNVIRLEILFSLVLLNVIRLEILFSLVLLNGIRLEILFSLVLLNVIRLEILFSLVRLNVIRLEILFLLVRLNVISTRAIVPEAGRSDAKEKTRGFIHLHQKANFEENALRLLRSRWKKLDLTDVQSSPPTMVKKDDGERLDGSTIPSNTEDKSVCSHIEQV